MQLLPTGVNYLTSVGHHPFHTSVASGFNES